MGEALIYEIIAQPITTCLVAIMIGIYLYHYSKNIDYTIIGLAYQKVVKEGHYWRAVTATFSHLNLLHLLFNMSSLWSLGSLEQLMGPVKYIRDTFLLLILSTAIDILVYHLLITRFNRETYLNTYAVGYSGVVFGLMTIQSQLYPKIELDLFGYVKLPMSFAPFASLIFTQILIPRASFIGHLSGIIVGFLISWHFFDEFSDYWFINSFIWVVIIFFSSVKATTSFPLQFITLHIEEQLPVRLTDGIIRRETNDNSVNNGV